MISLKWIGVAVWCSLQPPQQEVGILHFELNTIVIVETKAADEAVAFCDHPGIDENRSDQTKDVLHLQLVCRRSSRNLEISCVRAKMRRITCWRCGVDASSPQIEYCIFSIC